MYSNRELHMVVIRLPRRSRRPGLGLLARSSPTYWPPFIVFLLLQRYLFPSPRIFSPLLLIPTFYGVPRSNSWDREKPLSLSSILRNSMLLYDACTSRIWTCLVPLTLFLLSFAHSIDESRFEHFTQSVVENINALHDFLYSKAGTYRMGNRPER